MMQKASELFNNERTIIVLLLVASFYIVGSSYADISEPHLWRKADAYSQILGWAGFKDFVPFQNFLGKTVVYDIPIYEYLIAKLSALTFSDLLVTTKYLNLFFFFVVALTGYSISETLRQETGIYYLFLLCTSRFFLHYYAAPLPDDMSLALSMAGLAILLKSRNIKFIVLAGALWLVAALIKSPIPFIFVVFFSTRLLLQHVRGTALSSYAWAAIPISLALVGAIAAEKGRMLIMSTNFGGFAQDPSFYFGTLGRRFSLEFWTTMTHRAFSSNRALAACVPGLVYLTFRGSFRTVLPFAVAFLSGWLVFAPLYLQSDYYQLPGTILLFIVAAMGAQISAEFLMKKIDAGDMSARRLLRARNLILAVLAPLVVIYMPKLGEFHSTSFSKSVTYALRDVDHVMFVDDQYLVTDPAIGTQIATKFTRISTAAFEGNCASLIAANRAILVNGYSACLAKYKSSASTFIEDDGKQFYLKAK